MPRAARARGFPPVARRDARVLVLGSMPGVASLEAGQYYAHPRNRFWPLMQALLGVDSALPYARRCRALAATGVALWDVLAECERPGSLDADIRRGSERINDFTVFLATHPRIVAVACNGAAAHGAWRRHAAPVLGDRAPPVHRLSSTSPANAAVSLSGLRRAWAALPRLLSGREA